MVLGVRYTPLIIEKLVFRVKKKVKFKGKRGLFKRNN